MTRATKIAFAASAILGLTFGAYWGYSQANEISDSLESMRYIAPDKTVTDFARVQFMYADTDHARQAVLLQIHLLEQVEAADKTLREDGTLAFAYTRLAMVEEAAGRPDAEQSAMAQARTRSAQLNSRSGKMTDEEMKNAVKRLDQAAEKL